MPFDSSEYVGALPQVAPPVDPVLTIMLWARDSLSDPTHWCKVDFGRRGEAHCILGALIEAKVYEKLGDYISSEKWLMRFAPAPYDSLMWFNDAPETTHTDVLDLFDRAIAARRAEIGG